MLLTRMLVSCSFASISEVHILIPAKPLSFCKQSKIKGGFKKVILAGLCKAENVREACAIREPGLSSTSSGQFGSKCFLAVRLDEDWVQQNKQTARKET